ncbi:MAG: elongation factor Ts [Parcubacteria group bacterium]|nr:elongation factor Ts [Parcubacteria group bacterium]MBI2618206.1 elongation factor Ts [Candidatus Kaiserbacteria bacterium]
MATMDQIKSLRDLTGVSVMQCKAALEEADGDMEKAKVLLRKKGGDIAAKKSNRELNSGVVEAYIHTTKKVGALVVLSCETDFVAKNDEFVALARDIAMQVAALPPEETGEESKGQALLTQQFIKDPHLTVNDLIESATQKFGERIKISHFSRYSL